MVRDAAAWPRVAVFGAGAVGCWYGARLAQAGAPVVLIGRPAHVDAIRRDGLRVDSAAGSATVAIGADTSPDAVRGADLVLLCVKSNDTAAAAREIAPRLGRDAVVLSMQNGVDNVERAREAAGLDPVAAVVYVGASMGGPGRVVHAGRGDLVIGEFPGAANPDPARAARIADAFRRAGVGCEVSPDVRAALWTKLVVNAAYNAISALAGARYGAIVGDAGALALQRDLVEECAAVARADGVALAPVAALMDAVRAVGHAMTGATSSTEQDLSRGRPTEIDALNGFVVRRGDALGVPVPVNRAMNVLVRLRERAARP